MQPVHTPEKVVSSETVTSPETVMSSTASVQGNPAVSFPSELPSAVDPKALSQATVPARSNRVLQVVLGTAAIVAGMTVAAGATYVTGSFVLAQLETQRRSVPLPRLEPKPPIASHPEPVLPPIERTPPALNDLADAPARLQLDRATRLAAIDKFKEAIALANTIQPSSPSYEGAQQAINAWSGNLLQQAESLYAQRQSSAALRQLKAIPAASAAFPKAQQLLQEWQEQQQLEQANNQQHAQSAQHALRQSDGLIAIQEAEQITDAPGWQTRKAAIMRAAQPFAHVQRADELLAKDEPENAIHEANLLPSVAPWIERRERLVEKANQMIADRVAEKQRLKTCQELTGGYFSRCPDWTTLTDPLGQMLEKRLHLKSRKR